MVGEQEFGYRRLLMRAGHRPKSVLGVRPSLARAEAQRSSRSRVGSATVSGVSSALKRPALVQARGSRVPDCGVVVAQSRPPVLLEDHGHGELGTGVLVRLVVCDVEAR